MDKVGKCTQGSAGMLGEGCLGGEEVSLGGKGHCMPSSEASPREAHSLSQPGETHWRNCRFHSLANENGLSGVLRPHGGARYEMMESSRAGVLA